jgi:multimeric flavodoxin WrbA
MKKIVCLLGSPRKNGNSSTIAKHFCDSAEKLGAQISTFTLNKLNYKGCQACMGCKTKSEKCVIKDDLSEVLEAAKDADVLLMASPIYYGEVSSQMKGFIDRTFSYLVPDYLNTTKPGRLSPGKKMVVILTQGQSDQAMFADVFPKYDFFFRWYGFEDIHLIRACGVRDAGDVDSREDVMKLADELVKKVL